MRLSRVFSIFFLAALATFLLLSCKQQSDEKPLNLPFNAKNADWARIDLNDSNSAVQGFIDTKTYRPMGAQAAEFWHRLSLQEKEVITHLVLDCQGKKYRILAREVYDGKGTLLSQTTEASEWKNYSENSNAAELCLTLDPTGEAVIQKPDLPIIRDLLLKGMKRK